MKGAKLNRYVLAGHAGDEVANGPLELGDEVVVILRATVSKTSARTNADGVIVGDYRLTCTAGVLVDGELPAGVRKMLDAVDADRIDARDRLL